MPKKLPIFYSALLLTGVNLLLRLVGTSFQVYISGRIGAAGVGLLQLTMSVGSLAMVTGIAGVRTATMYLTAEDPQFEDVREICQEIASYLKPYNTPYEIIEDRAQAVEKAITTARPGDVIVLAAKGEEVYQKVRGEYVYYESDLAIAKRLLSL